MIRNCVLIPMGSVMIATSLVFEKLQYMDNKLLLCMGIFLYTTAIIDLIREMITSKNPT